MDRGAGSATAAAKKKKNGRSGSARSGGVASRGRPPRSAAVVVPMDRVLASNGALRDALASLGATRPWYLTEKQLRTSDVQGNQARLLFSCKSRGGAPAGPGPAPLLSRHPLAACFTELEAARVADKEAGLLVTALDGRGRSHDLTCKYLDSNHAYRFIAGWKAFVEANGLGLRGGESAFGRDVRVEVWAFRSRKLHNRYVDDRGSVGPDDADDTPVVGNGEGIDQLRADDSKIEKVSAKKKKTKKIREETGHPDGALGLVLLHYETNNAAVEFAGDAQEEERMDVEEAPLVTRQEDLAGAATDEQPEATWAMSKDEMVAKFGEKMAFAAIGMNMLRMGRWDRD